MPIFVPAIALGHQRAPEDGIAFPVSLCTPIHRVEWMKHARQTGLRGHGLGGHTCVWEFFFFLSFFFFSVSSTRTSAVFCCKPGDVSWAAWVRENQGPVVCVESVSRLSARVIVTDRGRLVPSGPPCCSSFRSRLTFLFSHFPLSLPLWVVQVNNGLYQKLVAGGGSA